MSLATDCDFTKEPSRIIDAPEHPAKYILADPELVEHRWAIHPMRDAYRCADCGIEVRGGPTHEVKP